MPELSPDRRPKHLVRIGVTIYVEIDADAKVNIGDIYTDLAKAKVKYNGRSVGHIYDWTTETREYIGESGGNT